MFSLFVWLLLFKLGLVVLLIVWVCCLVGVYFVCVRFVAFGLRLIEGFDYS